jgi:hypothetical protein
VKLAILPHERGGHGPDVRGNQTRVHRHGLPDFSNRAAQPDVIHPELGFDHRAANPVDPGRNFLDGGEVGRIDTGIGQVNQVRSLARHVCIQVEAAAFSGSGRRRTAEPANLQIRAESAPDFEVDDKLRLPGRAAGRRAIHIEVSIVAAQLDERLDIALLPPVSATSHPHPQTSISQHVLRAGREAEVGFGPFTDLQPPGDQPEGLLIDLGSQRAAISLPERDAFKHTRWRLVSQVGAVLGRDDRGDHLPARLGGGTRDAGDRRLRSADPGRADQAEPGKGEAGHHVRLARGGRGNDRHAEMLDQTEVGSADGVIGGTNRNPVQLPSARAAITEQPTVPDEVLVARNEAYDVTEDALVRSRRIENVVSVQVLGVESPVPPAAPAAQVTPGKDRHRTAQNPLAQGHPRVELT